MKNLYKALCLAALGCMVLSSCKTTEKNYQQAYDAAKARREAALAESMPEDGLISDDGPTLKVIDGDSVYVSRDRLSIPNDGSRQPAPYSVAVSLYKMPTNARAQAETLVKKGYDAYPARTTGDRWYVVAGVFNSQAEARGFIKEFKKKNPKYTYIGLPEAPVIVGF